jgi:iron complex transport system permease protein
VRGSAGLAVAAAALLTAILLAFAIGRFPVAPSDLVAVLWAAATGGDSFRPAVIETVVFGIRGPRVLAAVLVGAALAGSGAGYQALFRNPLVSPDILGVAAGASVGAGLGILFDLPAVAIQALAFGFGLAAVLAAWGVAASLRTLDPTLVLVLAGIALGALFGAAVGLIKMLADPYNQLPALTFWLLGSLAAARAADVAAIAPAVLVGLAPLWLISFRIDALAMSEDEARAMGIDTARIRAAVILGATLATAAVVSLAGTVGWVGLVVPHMARLLVGAAFARLLPASVLLGAGFLLLVDTLARSAGRQEVPLSVLTAIVGTPLFVGLLARARRAF